MDKRTEIIAIIQRVTRKPVKPAPDESLFDSGLLDSLSIQDLVNELETTFGISIPEKDLRPQKFDSIERIEEYLNSRS